jgi:hypothetical protein
MSQEGHQVFLERPAVDVPLIGTYYTQPASAFAPPARRLAIQYTAMAGTPKAADDYESYPSLFVWREPTEAERDFSEWIMASYAQGLGATRAPDDDTDLERRRNRPPFTFVRLIRVLWGAAAPVLLLFIGLASCGLIVAAYQLPELSLAQLTAIELAAGAMTFLLTPLVLKAAARDVTVTRAVLALGAASFGAGAYWTEGVTRHLCLEGGSGLVLLVGLELTLRRWQEAFAIGYRNALGREAKAELKRLEKLEQEQKARDEKRRLEELADTPITGLR